MFITVPYLKLGRLEATLMSATMEMIQVIFHLYI